MSETSPDMLSQGMIYKPLRRPTAMERYTPDLRVIDLRENGPRVVKARNIPFVGLITEPRLRKGLNRLGVTVGYLTLLLAVGLASNLGVARPSQTEVAKTVATPIVASVVELNQEKVTFLEEFLFEGFEYDEKIEASKKIVVYMREPDSLRGAARNLAQNIQGISSENLRPMNESKLNEKILLHLSETMPDASPTQIAVRGKLLKAVIAEESNSRPGVVNTAEDATGLGQVTPASFKEVLKRFKQNPSLYQKYFSDITIDLESEDISPEEREILIEKLKDPDINILALDELLRYYSELHSSTSMGLMAYGSNPTDLAQAEEAYAILVGKDNPIQVERDFKGVDEEDNFDPQKPPATKTYTKRFSLNPIKLMHEAVTAALKSSEHFMGVNWNYPWIIAARALGNDPDQFPAMAQMVEIAKADLVQTKV